jgi:serine/threonine-protein kinase RsbW
MSRTKTFDHVAESVGQARRFASQAIGRAPSEVVETVTLMVSELASNCIRHTNSRFELTVIRTAGEIRVEATDRGGGEPVIRSPRPTDPTGRGLQIVDMLASDWGVEHSPVKGKTVWFTVSVPARGRAGTGCAV